MVTENNVPEKPAAKVDYTQSESNWKICVVRKVKTSACKNTKPLIDHEGFVLFKHIKS